MGDNDDDDNNNNDDTDAPPTDDTALSDDVFEDPDPEHQPDNQAPEHQTDKEDRGKKRGGKGKAQKKPVSRKRKSATLPMGHSGDRTIKLIVSEHNVSECIVKKALIATKSPFEEVQYDKFKTC